MKQHLELLMRIPLFEGIKESELRSILSCLSARRKIYSKNEIIILAGEQISSIGIVLVGEVQIIREDSLGNRMIQAKLGIGELFGESFSCARVEPIPVTVLASCDSEVMLLDYNKIIHVCSSGCSYHIRLIENMMYIIARKNLILNQKLEHLSKRSIRGKLLSYLNLMAEQAGGKEFTIPFNRQELADYLCVDRSALSSELGKLRDEGIIKVTRREFELLK